MDKDQDSIIFAENVALVRSHDSNFLRPPLIFAEQFFDFTGDVNKTVQLEIAQSHAIAVDENLQSVISDLFGSWVESGNEDEQLEELYKSRLNRSTLPTE